MKFSILTQLDNPQLILTIELNDLYNLLASSNNLIDYFAISCDWKAGQNDIYPTNLIRATRTKAWLFMFSIDGYDH